MKKILLAVSLLALAATAFCASATQQIRFATSATNPPFEFLNPSNQLDGFDIDLAKALCQHMQAECTFTNQAFDSLIPALRFKKFDAVIASLDITPERSKQVDFSDPYYANSAEVVSKKGGATSFKELEGKRIGTENGTTHQRYLQDTYPKITVVPYDGYQNAFLDLQNGRIDGVFGDTAAINSWMKTMKHQTDLEAIIPRVTDVNYFGTGLGIAVQQGNKELLSQINTALQALRDDGTWQKLIDKWDM